MIYVLTENGEPYTYHLDYAEMEKYIKELRQVYPQSDWDFEPKTTGRLSGQAEMIWGGECLVDAITHEIHQWMKVYIWRDMPWTAPAVGEKVYRYIPMNFETTNNSDAPAVIKKRLKDMEFVLLENDLVERVR